MENDKKPNELNPHSSFREAAYRRASTAGPSLGKKPTPVNYPLVSATSSRSQGFPGSGSNYRAAPPAEPTTNGDILISKTIECGSDILTVKYTQDFSLIAIGMSNGVVQVNRATNGQKVMSLRDADDTNNASRPATCIKHRTVHKSMPNTDTITCTYTNGNVRAWHVQTGVNVYTINEGRQVLGLAYHHRLPKFVTVGDDSKILLYDEETKTQEAIFENRSDGNSSRVFAACFNPKLPHEFISGGWDDTVQFWDLRRPTPTRHISGPHICGDGLDISRTGTEVLSCSWQKQNQIQLWDYGTGKLITTIVPDQCTSSLYCGRWVNKDYIIVGGSTPGTIRMIDLRTMSTTASIEGLGGVYSLDVGQTKQQNQGKSKQSSKSADIMPKLIFCSGKKLFEVETF